ARRSTFEGGLARMDAAFESVETLPCRLRCLVPFAWRVDRWFCEPHGRNVARTVRKNCFRSYAHNELRSHRIGEQRIVVAHRRDPVDAQPSRLVVHRDEQYPDVRIDQDISQTLEHAVAVVIGKCQFGRPGDAYKSGHTAFE